MILVLVTVSVSSLLALVVVGLLVGKVRVPPVVGLIPAALPLLAVLVGQRLDMASALDAVATQPLEVWDILLADYIGVTQESAGAIAFLTAVPGLILLLGGAVVGALRGPRQLVIAGVGAGLAVVLALLSVLTIDADYGLWPMLRPPVVLVAGLLAAVALLGRDPEHTGPEAAGLALAFPLTIGGFELTGVLYSSAQTYLATANASPETRSALWAMGTSLVEPVLSGALLLVLGASIVGLLGLGAAAATSGARRVGALAALVWLPVAPLTLAGVDATGTWVHANLDLRTQLFPPGTDELQLPTSTSIRSAQLGPTVRVSQHGITADRGEVLLGDLYGAVEDGHVPALTEWLTASYESRRELLRGELDRREILLQIDQRTPYALVGPVLASLQRTGWNPVAYTAYGTTIPLALPPSDLAPPPPDMFADLEPIERPQPRATAAERRAMDREIAISAGVLGALGTGGLQDEPFIVHLGAGGITVLSAALPASLLPLRGEVQDVDAWDLEGLRRAASHVKDERPNDETVHIAIDGEVPWEILVAALDVLREDDHRDRYGERRILFPLPVLRPEPGMPAPTVTPSAPAETTDLGLFGPRPSTEPASSPRAASGPQITASEPTILGTLPRQEIDRVVTQHMNQVRYCYQRELTRTPDLAGRVAVKFVVAADGSVSSSTVDSSTVGSAAVESCVASRFMRMQFPTSPSGGIVIVTYPFHFSPG